MLMKTKGSLRWLTFGESAQSPYKSILLRNMAWQDSHMHMLSLHERLVNGWGMCKVWCVILNQIKIKSNHFYCHITTAQVPWWVKFLWACSRQCKKTTDNLPMDRQCKKNNKQFTYGQTVQKNNRQFTYGQTVQKKQQTIYIWTDSAKKQQQFTYGQTVQKNNSNLHMDSTYLQTVQKTMCKIHIHILSTHSVL